MSECTATEVEPMTPQQVRLVEDHMPLARAIAQRWRSSCRTSIEHEELVQVGYHGLIQAARRYDPDRGEFAPLAAGRVRGAICDFLRSLDPLTRDRRRAVREVQRTSRSLSNAFGREPGSDEVAQSLGWSSSRVEETRRDVAALARGWSQVCDATHLAETEVAWAEGEESTSAFQGVLSSERRATVAAGLGALPARERLVLEMHYGQEVTITAIGAMLGVTPSRVSQLHSAGVNRLRTHLTGAAARHAHEPAGSRARCTKAVKLRPRPSGRRERAEQPVAA